MSVVSDIEIRLRADIARLQQDMTQVRTAVSGAMQHVQRVTNLAGQGLKALGGYFAVDAILSYAKATIDAVDAIGDISPATGVAVKDIAGLQLAFQFGGLEASEFEKTMIKLSTKIADNDDTFKRLGITTRTATGEVRASKDVLYDVADAFAKAADGTNKTAVATELFGKSGAALIPTLNNGAEGLRDMAEMADKLGLSFTEAGVEAAGQFNDSLDTLGLATQGIARQVAVQLLPSLNDLVGSFANLIVEGNGVGKAAAVIGTGFKIIYTAGLAVYQVFDTLSSIIAISIGAVLDGFGTVAKSLKYFIEGEYSKAWDAAVSGSRGAVNNIKNLGDDMVDSWSASATAIVGAWDGTSGKVIEDFAAMSRAGKLAAKATKEQEEAAKAAAADAKKLADEQKKAAEAYANLIDAVQERIYATGREADGLAALTESQKLSRDLGEQLRTGKIQLTAAETRYYQSLIETLAVNEDIIDANKKRIEDEKEWARIRKDVAEVQEESARKEAEARAREWESFEKTAHDTFVSIADGGKSAATRLKETFKNTFFDWLYQMTLKKWIINVQTATAGGAAGGAGGLSSLIGAATSGNGIVGAVGNLYSSLAGGATLAGGLGTGFLGSLAGGLNGAGVGSGLTSALGLNLGNSIASTLGPTISGALSSGLGAIATAMPWVAGAAAVLAIGKKAFGRGPKETTSTGIAGMFGDEGFSGQSYSEWVKKGGWFRSDKRGTDTGALDAEMAAALSSAYKGMKDSATAFAEALGVPADSVASYSKQIKLAFTGDAAKDQQALVDLLGQVGDELATRVLPNIGLFIKEGETAATTLQRLAVEFQTVGAIVDALGAVGVSSIEARTRLVELSGGLEALATQYEFFNANFMTEAQRIAPVQEMVTKQLADLGLAGITTTEQFRDAVLDLASSGAMATEEGAKQYAGLMALAPAYKLVADYLAETKRAAEELAAADAARAVEEAARAMEEAARAASVLADENERQVQAANALVDNMLSGVQRAVAAQKDAVSASYQRTMAELQVSIDSVGASIEATTALSRALADAVGSLSVGGEVAMRAAGQAQITAALRAARATGVLPTAEELKDALTAVSRDNSDQFSTFADYVRSTARTANDLEELGRISGSQTSIAERQLAALVAQRDQATAYYNAELLRLDGVLLAAQMQVDALRGVDNSVQSVVAALAGLQGALAGAARPPVASANGTTTGLSVEETFRSVLGREGAASGIAFWKNAFGDAVDATELQSFLRGAAPELEAKSQGKWQEFLNSAGVPNPVYTSQQSGTMGGGAMLAELQTLNSRMANVEKSTGQFAQQFDNVTAGGNVVLTEAAQ